MTGAREIVERWHLLLAAGDLVAATVLVAKGVEVSGPRGTETGTPDVVRAWVERSGIRLVPRGVHARGDAVVVEQAARWPDPERPDGLTDASTVYSAFQVSDGRITRILRFDALAPALAVSGLTEADRVATSGGSASA